MCVACFRFSVLVVVARGRFLVIVSIFNCDHVVSSNAVPVAFR
jgi:hypothetical protein